MKPFIFNKSNTFCISVLSRQDRWEKMVRRFKNTNLDASRWIASTPNDLTDNFLETLEPLQKACAQSHVNLWKYLIANNMEYMFILEDDACFDKQWYEKLNQVRYEIKDQSWHMITLNANGRNSVSYKWEKISCQWLLAGYILSLEGAKLLLDLYKEKFDIADVMTIKLQGYGKSYGYFPWPIIQENGESTLGNNYTSEYQTVIRRLKQISYPIENYDI